MEQTFSYQQVYKATLEYFHNNEMLTNVWLSKYCLKNNKGQFVELTPEERLRKIAVEITRIEGKFNNLNSKDINLFEERVYQNLKKFTYHIPGGSILFGIANPYYLTSLGNCFVIGNDIDSYGSINLIDEEQVQLMKRRGGVGHDLSHLRPKLSSVNGCASTSTGAVSFVPRYSNSTREVAQDGRRGALMLSFHINHPDVVDFIECKDDRKKNTGCNISVKVTDEFMLSVENDEGWGYHFPINSNSNDIFKGEDARDIFKKIVHQAWKNGEPGLLFWDKILNESPADCYKEEGFETVSTNPCFTGDTIIAIADGDRNGLPIRDLVGKNFLVYSGKKRKVKNNRGSWWVPEIKKATAFKTGKKKIVEILLSDGSSFKCTPDHQLATLEGEWVQAKDSLNLYLEKFYTTSEKNIKSSYRCIKSITNGYAMQTRLIWEYHNGKYDGTQFNIDHIDCNSTNDILENLRLLTIQEHKNVTKRLSTNNPINRVYDKGRYKLLQKRKNILANATKYNWDKIRLDKTLREFDSNFNLTDREDKNVYLIENVYVEKITYLESEDVYDLSVEDNHNFYIITKTDDSRYLNCSGILVHNCGEIPLATYDSCRLYHLNLYSFVRNPFTSNTFFDYEAFKCSVRQAVRNMDNVLELETEKISSIINHLESSKEPREVKAIELNLWRKVLEKLVKGRRVGIGILGEADMLASLNLVYGTKEANDFAIKVHKIMAIEAYAESIQLAKERGPFPIWNLEKEKDNPFLNRILSTLKEVYPNSYEDYLKIGRRNIALLTIAPTGSTSLFGNCRGVSSGMEPVFEIAYKRRRKINENDKQSIATFVDEVGDKWEEYVVVHPVFEEWYIQFCNKNKVQAYKLFEQLTYEEIQEFIKLSPYNNATANYITVLSKIKLQGEIQKWIDHSISITHNLPKHTTEEEIYEYYLEAWKSGCKGCTVYRDGSREGVLIRNDSSINEEVEAFRYVSGSNRPKILDCEIHRLQALKENWFVIVGLYNKLPYEIFAVKEDKFPWYLKSLNAKDYLRGTVLKRKSKVYDLITHRNDTQEPLIIEDLVSLLESVDDRSDTRRFSLELRHRIHPKEIIETIEKQQKPITSFEKAICRVLKKYIPDGESSGLICEECGSSDVHYEGGCPICRNCGNQKCG